jgi:dual-specificity kinase
VYVYPREGLLLYTESASIDRTVRLLGQGTFGKVVEAYDNRDRRRVAVKIIRAIQKYRDASRIEMRVLEKLKEKDPTNRQ